jgi:hypothetical protein
MLIKKFRNGKKMSAAETKLNDDLFKHYCTESSRLTTKLRKKLLSLCPFLAKINRPPTQQTIAESNNPD